MRMPWRNITREEGDASGSLLFAIGQALDRAREGQRNDEAHALAANKIVRRCLDKRAITYQEYKRWRSSNPLIFTPIVDDANQLIAFFDIFPLTTQAGEDIIAGRLTERSLRIDHILPIAEIARATHLHIATILLNPRQRVFAPLVAKEVLLLKMRDFLDRYYAPIETRTYLAFAQTRAGEALLKRCGFSVAVLASENDQHCPLYVLRPTDTATAIFRFDRADNSFSRKAILRRLDSRLELIELQLRALIASAINSDSSLIPPHVTQKINDRLRTEAHKNAAFDIDLYKGITARLEFCDLRELQDTILSKSVWPNVQDRFVNKETLAVKFGQMAGLRNAIRHSRAVDEVTLKEGEAGIIWFERVLSKASPPREDRLTT